MKMKKTAMNKIIFIAILLILTSYVCTFATKAQEICPGTSERDGVIRMNTSPSSSTSFVAGLLGTLDRASAAALNNKIYGGIAWLYSDVGNFSTTEMGGQLIGWWTRDNDRNTLIQVTNQQNSEFVDLHIQFFDEDCTEVRGFCDVFTPYDTHVYDLSNLVTNGGSPVPTNNLTDHEGIVTVTPVVDCSDPDWRAISFPFLHGNIKINSTVSNYEYGTNMWSRDTITTSCTDMTGSLRYILDGDTNCRFESVLPTRLSHVFSSSSSNLSRADLVIITISDSYDSGFTPEYTPIPGSSSVQLNTSLVDLFEEFVSCGEVTGCFLRLGINNVLPNSDVPFPPTIELPGNPPFDPPGPPPSRPGPPLP